uniref:Uncharacterized protein n=1 Tax=Timema shepardi TaxID=629360 RepID=A0A7R9FZA2_TIMSH|nr:unnamed protein product [Timema shepardi]
MRPHCSRSSVDAYAMYRRGMRSLVASHSRLEGTGHITNYRCETNCESCPMGPPLSILHGERRECGARLENECQCVCLEVVT